MSQHNPDYSETQETPIVMKDVSWFDFKGIQVPYVPSEQVTMLTDQGEVVKDIPPAYITNLKTVLETGSERAMENAILSMEKEALLSLVRGSTFQCEVWEAPCAVSNSVPYGMVYLDFKGGRVILNEKWATEKYIDADGDRISVLLSPDKKKALIVKFPITSQPPIVEVTDIEPMEIITDLGKKEIANLKRAQTINDREVAEGKPSAVPLDIFPEVKRLGVNANAEELFRKSHEEVKVGLLTNAWNCLDLWESSPYDPKGKNMTWEDRMEYIFNSHLDPQTKKPQRAIDIEDGGMKAARKTGKDFAEAEVLKFGAGKALAHHHAWALTSASSIGSMLPRQLSWFPTTDLDALMEKILKLEVDFRDVTPGVNAPELPVYVESNLLTRLLRDGLIRYQEIPHINPALPPAVLLWLTLPSGTPVALTDIKREGREEGETYAFVIAPIFDNLTLYNEFGKPVVPATRTWQHPINHLQKVLMTIDTTIRPFADGPISHYFPLDLDDWRNPKRAIKISMLFKALVDFCGRYGDPSPATRSGDSIILSQCAESTIRRTVVIDYGRNMGWKEMYGVAKAAYAQVPFCFVGRKGTSRRIGKYMLSNAYGGTCLDPEGLSGPHRGAKNRSQLQRALKPVVMRTAIVQLNTRNQIQITPSGIEKQRATNAFMPRVFSTREAYEKHLEAHHLTEEDEPATETMYQTWQGEFRRCWTIGSRRTITIGKLIDVFGNKFMPRYHQQCHAIRYGEGGIQEMLEVDLLFPITELVDKDAHHALLKDAVEHDLVLPDGSIVKCMLVEHLFFRTGAASENVPPRWRRAAYKGIDSFPIYWQYSKINPKLKPRKADTTFAKALQKVVQELTGQGTISGSPIVHKFLES